jgi:hypothetical protein
MRERLFGLSVLAAAGATFAGVYALVPLPSGSKPVTTNSRAIEASVYYSGCNEARLVGAAPIHRGQPGYREEMDGDGDGIACEPHRTF